jgi:hypothetical protein
MDSMRINTIKGEDCALSSQVSGLFTLDSESSRFQTSWDPPWGILIDQKYKTLGTSEVNNIVFLEAKKTKETQESEWVYKASELFPDDEIKTENKENFEYEAFPETWEEIRKKEGRDRNEQRAKNLRGEDRLQRIKELEARIRSKESLIKRKEQDVDNLRNDLKPFEENLLTLKECEKNSVGQAFGNNRENRSIDCDQVIDLESEIYIREKNLNTIEIDIRIEKKNLNYLKRELLILKN